MKDKQRIKVLLIEDNPVDARLIREMLSEDSNVIFELFHADQISKGFKYLERKRIDVILLDLGLPDSEGLDTLRLILPRAHQIPIIVETGLADKDLAIRTVKAGAQDYLIKGQINSPLLKRSILYAIERKRMEESLRESEERFRLLTESSPVAILLFQNNKWVYANSAAKEISGYTDQELQVMNFWDIVHPAYRQLAQELGQRRQEAEAITNRYELKIITKDGTVKWIDLSGATIVIGGRPAAIISVLDINERKRAEEKLQHTLESLRKAVGTTIQVMVSAIEMRDPYTAGHQLRSADIARSIATEMGLSPDKIDGIRMAGIIHDIGKLSVPTEVLSKPKKLTSLEFSLIKEHSQSGYEMLKDVESPWPLAEIVYQHHERMNGSGYPRNLKGDDILLEARILAVADVVEAMASHRPYRASLGIKVALKEIKKNKGILYDEAVVDACLRLFIDKGYQLA